MNFFVKPSKNFLANSTDPHGKLNNVPMNWRENRLPDTCLLQGDSSLCQTQAMQFNSSQYTDVCSLVK